MSDGPISADGGAIAVTGPELIPMVQSGVNKNTSPTFITALINKLTTKGDLLSHDGTTPVRFPAGANGEVPIYDSTQTSGFRAGTPTGSGGSSVGSSARAFRPTTQSISDNTETAIAFANETFDTDSIHDVSSNNSRLTVKKAGKQLALAAVEFAANANGYREIRLRINGTTYIGVANCVAPSSATPARLVVLGEFDGIVNDYVEVMVLQTSGAALNVNAGEGVTWCALTLSAGDGGDIRSDGSIPFAADQSMGSHKLTNVTNPSSAQDAATKAYVDSVAGMTVPTSTGFVHITAAVEDGAARAVDVSSADVTGTLAAARFPALTSDVTTSAGSLATTLATVNSNVGSFGDGTHVAALTVNAKGLITAASSVAITATGAPGGSTTEVQYNSSSAFAGDSRFFFDATNKVVKGQFTIDSSAVNAQTGTTYTINATDNGGVVTLSNASAITVTVPSGLGKGFSCICIQIGAGQVTFVTSSTTINPSTMLKIAAQHGAASLIAYIADTFNLSGNIST